MATLVRPSARYKRSYLHALKEFTETEREHWFDMNKLALGFPALLKHCRDMERGVNLPKGYVPATTYWLVDGTTFIGKASLRHRLNAHLRWEGGHIGYVIRPSKRKSGYGKEILKLALRKAKALGIRKALVTCDEGNEGSRKIIEANGGVFKDKVKRKKKSNQGGDIALRYWIPI